MGRKRNTSSNWWESNLRPQECLLPRRVLYRCAAPAAPPFCNGWPTKNPKPEPERFHLSPAGQHLNARPHLHQTLHLDLSIRRGGSPKRQDHTGMEKDSWKRIHQWDTKTSVFLMRGCTEVWRLVMIRFNQCQLWQCKSWRLLLDAWEMCCSFDGLFLKIPPI